MTHHTKLLSLDKLLTESWKFFQDNWKRFVGFFLVLEIPLLVFSLISIFTNIETNSIFILSVGTIASMLASLIISFRKFAILGSGILADSTEEYKGVATLKLTYLELFKKLIPLVWIMILVMLCFFSIFFITTVLGTLIFVMPFLGLKLIAGIFGSAPMLTGAYVTFFTGILVLLGILLVHFLFFIYTYFAGYTFVIEGRKGIDALTSSYLYVKGRAWKIFLRLFVILIISAIPSIIIIGPAYIHVILDNIETIKIAIANNISPVLNPNSIYVSLWFVVSSFVASIIWMPWFAGALYTLWKDIKSTSVDFDEKSYMKTRATFKALSWMGVLTLIIFVFGALIVIGLLYERFPGLFLN